MVPFLLTLAALPFILPIVAIVMARQARSQVNALQERIDEQTRELEFVRRRLREMDRHTPARPATVADDALDARAAVPAVRPHVPPSPSFEVATPTVAHVPQPPPQPPAIAPPPATAPPTHVSPTPTLPMPPPPVPTPAPAPAPDSVSPVPEHAHAASGESAPTTTADTPPPVPLQSPTPPPQSPADAPVGPDTPWWQGLAGGFDWENLIGVRLFSVVAGLALATSGLLFVRYSVDQGWLQPPVRAAIGVIVATALLVICERKAARRYPLTANALDGAAIAILFSTVFASHALWQLIGAAVAFGLLALVTTLAVLLSVRRDSLFIAVLGLLGGFATPVLVSTGDNRPIALFGYLLLLTTGLSWVARQRRWPWLPAAALALTTIYQWGWVARFLDAPQLPIAYGIFLVFPLAQLAIARLGPRRRGGANDDQLEARTEIAGSVLPVLFVIYAAASPRFANAYHLHLGVAWLATVGLFAIAYLRGPWLLHAAGNAAAVTVWAAWATSGGVPDSWPWGLAWLAAFVLTFVALPEFAARRGRAALGAAAHADLAAPAVLLVSWILATSDAAAESPWPLFGTMAVLVAATAAWAVGRERGPIYFAAALVLMVAEGLWIARHLTSDRLGTALGILASGTALLVVTPIMARRLRRPLDPPAGAGVVQLVALGVLLVVAQGPLAPAALWGLGLLLAGLNVGLVIESAAATLPLLSWAGGIATWLVLGVWWSGSANAVPLLPALTVVLGLALVMLAGMVWAHRHRPLADGNAGEDGDERRSFSGQPALVLGAHLFLFAAAADPSRSLPPWPVFGVLAVLTLALTVTAVALGRLVFHAAGLAAAVAVVFVWTSTSTVAPWPTIALAALAAIATYAAATLALSRWRPAHAPALATGTGLSLVLVHLVAVTLGGHAAAPPLVWWLSLHAAVLGLLLWLTARHRWPFVSLGLVATSWAAVAAWRGAHTEAWTESLVATALFYGISTGFGFVRVGRDDDDGHTYLTAVAATVPAFFLATALLRDGGLGHIVGIVPVVLAAGLYSFLRRLLALAADTPDALTRTAVVAGAALAFVTVAIPLHLDTKWITVGWALEGAALAWLWTRVPHRGLLFWSTGLLATVFVRLALNPAVFAYVPRGARVLNWYLYVYLLAAAAMFLAARWMADQDDRLLPKIPRVSTVLQGGGAVLLFWLLNIEIADYYSDGARIVFRFGADVGQDLTYTVGWLVFGIAALAVGIVRASRPPRLAAIALLTVTSAKCFLYDLSQLEGLFRVASFVGLAISLVLVSLAIQRFVLRLPASAEAE